jgi:putative superfamily III holin-X
VNGEGLSGATRRVADHARSLVELELRLAAAEMKAKLQAFAAGLGLSTGAAVLLLYAVGFGLAAAAAGIATELPLWASLLIVFGALLLLATLLGAIGVALIRQSAKPVPEQALEEAQLTTEALRDGQ